MEISNILSPNRVINNGTVSSKKAALEALANLISSAEPNLTQAEVFESLIAREKLGSTSLGNGIALPHGRQKGGTQAIGAFIQLHEGIQYDTVDLEPVDLLFALSVPEESTEEHLEILSKLASILSDSSLVNNIRSCDSPESIFTILTKQ